MHLWSQISFLFNQQIISRNQQNLNGLNKEKLLYSFFCFFLEFSLPERRKSNFRSAQMKTYNSENMSKVPGEQKHSTICTLLSPPPKKPTKIALHPFRNETNTFITRPVLLLNLQSTNVIEGQLLTFRLKKAPTARSPLFNFQPSVSQPCGRLSLFFYFYFFKQHISHFGNK